MKYADMQQQLNSGRFDKRPRTPPPRPQHPLKQAPEPPVLPELRTVEQLLQRLIDLGADPYHGASYPDLAERLGCCIRRNHLETRAAGSWEGCIEAFALTFERLVGRLLPDPRGTISDDRASTDVTT